MTQTRTPSPAAIGAVTGSVKWLLRLEGAAALAAAVLVYRHLGGSWGLFAAAFLAPDLAMAGYLAGPRAGAWAYNLAHSYLAPALLALAGWAVAAEFAWTLAAIWAAHIGFDRSIGYGLKYPHAFGATHLGFVGKRAPA